MTVGASLRAALRDFYENSWRLVPLNSLLSLALILVVVAALYADVALLLLLLVFPLALAVMHCAVELVRERVLSVSCFGAGLRALWRRGLELAALNVVVGGGCVFGIVFYARGSALVWPFAFLLLYVLVAFAAYQLHLWPLAVDEPRAPLRDVLRRAARALLQRPRATFGLALALLLVNLAGVAAALMPFLTLTVAYSFLAAAHFALPHRPLLEG